MASVKVSERIEASADRVWGLLRDFGGIHRYAAGIETCTVEGEGVGAVRTLGLPGGAELQERLEALDDASRRLRYAIVAGPIPLSNYLATVEVRDEGEGCRVDWSSTFEPKGISEDQARGMVEGIYKGGIAGLRRLLGA
jgi:carbon monoxide dehydrogenase subunit G